MNYSIEQDDRQRMTLRVLSDGTVKITVPHSASPREIEEFVARHDRWIRNRQKELEQSGQDADGFFRGERLLYLGREIPLVCGQPLHSLWSFNGSVLYCACETGRHFSAVHDFYRCRAEEIIPDLVRQWEARLGVRANGVQINSATTRWGSCSPAGQIHFSRYLMMASPESGEYVVVHELAHLLQHNHSPAFWRIVAKCLPDYRARKAGLKQVQSWMNAVREMKKLA